MSIAFALIALFSSITFHEFMHAWVANFLGDPTAKYAGRMTLNPIAHIDPFGTILMPLLLIISTGGRFAFGYAKPVPINPNNFKNYQMGEILTSIAGPMANLILFILFVIIYKLLPTKDSYFTLLTLNFISINAVLMIFNLIPLPPLDGSKVLLSVLPYQMREKLEIYGPFILIPFIIFFAPAILGPILSFLFSFFGIPLGSI